MHELEGKGRNTTEQNCVFTCCFEMEDDYDETNKSPNDSDLANCKHFLSLLSREAGVFVETVTNTSGYNIIYASAKFLRRMGKSYNKAYKAKRLTLSITDEEKEMLSAIKRK